MVRYIIISVFLVLAIGSEAVSDYGTKEPRGGEYLDWVLCSDFTIENTDQIANYVSHVRLRKTKKSNVNKFEIKILDELGRNVPFFLRYQNPEDIYLSLELNRPKNALKVFCKRRKVSKSLPLNFPSSFYLDGSNIDRRRWSFENNRVKLIESNGSILIDTTDEFGGWAEYLFKEPIAANQETNTIELEYRFKNIKALEKQQQRLIILSKQGILTNILHPALNRDGFFVIWERIFDETGNIVKTIFKPIAKHTVGENYTVFITIDFLKQNVSYYVFNDSLEPIGKIHQIDFATKTFLNRKDRVIPYEISGFRIGDDCQDKGLAEYRYITVRNKLSRKIMIKSDQNMLLSASHWDYQADEPRLFSELNLYLSHQFHRIVLFFDHIVLRKFQSFFN